MKILSHRGFHLGAAGVHENTPAAFERAIALGVDGIETDIRLTADGVPILFHDRVAPGDQPVASLTHRELQKAVGYEIPTLSEVLARWPEVFWNLEVKCLAAVPVTVDLVTKHPRPERILVTSFRHDIVRECAERLNVACGLIVAHAPLDVPNMLAPWQGMSRVRTIVWDFNVLDGAIAGPAKAIGFKVYAYGLETPDEHTLCRTWGLDGVITDYPDRARGGCS
jgi:glycerophosphoryl diester phosphodiesterase